FEKLPKYYSRRIVSLRTISNAPLPLTREKYSPMVSPLKRPPENFESSKKRLWLESEISTFWGFSFTIIVSSAKFRYVSVDGLPHLIDLNVVQLVRINNDEVSMYASLFIIQR
ncbi:MAG: hypothetical protein K2L93_01835, partial [Muribaculaceae bacterium]|nr:hypothetical protein [Muribaculaceae bacterium]